MKLQGWNKGGLTWHPFLSLDLLGVELAASAGTMRTKPARERSQSLCIPTTTYLTACSQESRWTLAEFGLSSTKDRQIKKMSKVFIKKGGC